MYCTEDVSICEKCELTFFSRMVYLGLNSPPTIQQWFGASGGEGPHPKHGAWGPEEAVLDTYS